MLRIKNRLHWDTAKVIGETKEERWTYRSDGTGDVKVIIKAKNAAGFYSDEVFTNLYCLVEPQIVTGFIALQNGEYVELFWNKHPEPDVTSYEIREGASFESGALVASGVTVTDYKIRVDVKRNYQYHIKAINRSQKYSLNAASCMIYVDNLPPKNVIKTFDELRVDATGKPLGDGTKSNVEFGPSLITWQNIGGKWSDYKTTKFSDVGGGNVLKLAKDKDSKYYSNGSYVCTRKDMGQVITASITCDFRSSVVLRGTGTAILQIRTSQDGTAWTAWQDFRPAQYTFRYLDAQVLLSTSDTTKTPEVNHFVINIDVPDIEATGKATISQGGTTINYSKNFYDIPVVTPTALGDNRFAVVTDKTKTGFTVKITDRAGTDVGGQLDWRARGY